MIEPLRSRYQVEMAYGMADPDALAAAILRLESRGAKKIVVARLYGLSEHTKERTEYILGVRSEPPAGRGGEPPPRVRASAVFSTFGGYEEDPEIAEVLKERIVEISRDPGHETVILLAHGSGDDEGNEKWLSVMRANVDRVERQLSQKYRSINVAALREDWPAKRDQALKEIKEMIVAANGDGGRVLLISNRLHGAGPYPRLLQGLDFVLNDKGFIHPVLTRWLARRIDEEIEKLNTFPPALTTATR